MNVSFTKTWLTCVYVLAISTCVANAQMEDVRRAEVIQAETSSAVAAAQGVAGIYKCCNIDCCIEYVSDSCFRQVACIDGQVVNVASAITATPICSTPARSAVSQPIAKSVNAFPADAMPPGFFRSPGVFTMRNWRPVIRNRLRLRR